MRYIDILKMQIQVSGWMCSAVIISYGIVCYLGSIQPIHISIGMVRPIVSMIFFNSLALWWFNSLKK